ncbi:MAG: class I SAM-dependent methyltransferase [Planctomycetes bacterium]|nr:class I SAM-dependent methyltransferase [Planctomycetota bacterium]
MELTFKLILSYLSPRCLYALLRRQIWIRMHPHVPWLTHQAVEILGDRLKPGDVGLEWGAGRSTVWFAKRVSHLTSIEHNDYWYKRINKTLCDKGIENVELLYAPLEPKNTDQPEYVRLAAQQPKASLDFVLVDGRLRDQCTELALQLLKPGGMLIIDDAARYIKHPYCCPQSIGAQDGPPTPLWTKIATELQALGARPVWTSDGVTATVFYFMSAGKV